ncbi:class II fumarate hydratase [Desulfosoma caldarium]|uniref:Fumarate hydratase class II n=1 Tax=Desulfosoma caldarium TaxID=610254 RepID=A0A3N1UHB5_9BACT|nr:class II fumarate hydratase [Desulfosoma caldarium]ROQ90655.1 fumarase class II [Desulfosoma caldarium]
MDEKGFRVERDTLGEILVPKTAYYGAQTQRAVENFPLSGRTMPRPFLEALALIKQKAAEVHAAHGRLDSVVADAIIQAAGEVRAGKHWDQFPVDVFQTGSGTSTNMNMNEVLAGRANEILTGRRGGKHPVHPNDHVNMAQSSNDVIPTALHIAAWRLLQETTLPALSLLEEALREKADAFADVLKIGRTHAQDALPVTLGQEFSGYARQIALAAQRLGAVEPRLCEVALGGTAVGTGVGVPPDFVREVLDRIHEETGLRFREAENHFEAQSAQDAVVETGGALKTAAVSLWKIANDLRWLASGPRCGLGEIQLPALQPGSSMMPGKVNPVILEAVLQAAARVLGNDTTLTLAGQAGLLELHMMLPLLADTLLESIELIGRSARVLAEKCVRGIEAHRARCAAYVEQSLALATYLVPLVGYDRAAQVAQKAYDDGITVREAALSLGVASPEAIEKALAEGLKPTLS